MRSAVDEFVDLDPARRLPGGRNDQVQLAVAVHVARVDENAAPVPAEWCDLVEELACVVPDAHERDAAGAGAGDVLGLPAVELDRDDVSIRNARTANPAPNVAGTSRASSASTFNRVENFVVLLFGMTASRTRKLGETITAR